MHIRGVSLNHFDTVVHDISHQHYAGNVTVSPDARPAGRNAINARLRVTDSRGPGARTAASGRHGPYACWHAYRDVLRWLFCTAPDATVRTTLATYRGEQGFQRDYPDTAYHNVGSALYPAHMPDLCVRARCGDGTSPWQPQEPAAADDDILDRISRELREVDLMRPEPLIFEGPDSLMGVPDLAYSGR